MIALLFEAATRSVLLAIAVWAGLRVFQVRNVLAQKAAWTLVLAAAVTMPLLMPAVARFQAATPHMGLIPGDSRTLLQELQSWIVANSARFRPAPVAEPAPSASAAPDQKTAEPASEAEADDPAPSKYAAYSGNAPVVQQAPARAFPLAAVLLGVYLAVSAVLLMRLSLGLLASLRLLLRSEPVSSYAPFGESVKVRMSSGVSSPITLGSYVLLPESYTGWEAEKLRAVLAHESSHVWQGDSYLQIVAAVYAALFWISPLGWFLKGKLSDLAEAISDHAALSQSPDRPSYAEMLLEFAASPRPTVMGVAMARRNNLSGRIERLLNESTFRQAFAGSRRALAAVLLVPLALVGESMLVRVHAAGQSAAAPVVPAPPPPPVAAAAPEIAVTAMAPAVAESPAPAAAPDAAPVAVPEPISAPAAAAPMVQNREGGQSFERTLTVSGQPQLNVATGSGDIKITRGTSGQVRVVGHVEVSRDGDVEEARRIAANPPIEQEGNVIRIGQQHGERWQGISISYQIQAPADSQLSAASGSGDVVVDGVGQHTKLTTGSGNVTATGIQGGFNITTGSGDIRTSAIGEGDSKVLTGSGDIEIKGVHGGLTVQTGSGDISAAGTPTAAWVLRTGSGSVDIASGSSGLNLEASTASGTISANGASVQQEDQRHHHLVATLNGGGPSVHVETGSGDISVH